MQPLMDLLRDNESLAGRAVTSAAVIAIAVVVAWAIGLLFARRAGDPQSRYYARKFARYAVGVLAVLVLAVVWRPFAGRIGVVLGLATAAIAFAMQEVIGAVAGWVNILSGRIFRVGDRIQMGGVRGDVIDVTLLRTKLMEIGSADVDDGAWVHGRQFTGRIVTVSNKATFTEPVFNYSASFDYLWEELTIPVGFDADWRRANEIIGGAAVSVSTTTDAAAAINRMRRTFPIPPAELQPTVFAVPTDNYMELTARFVVPVRTARTVKDRLSRQIVDELAAAGIEVASTTGDLRVDLRESDPAHPSRDDTHVPGGPR